MKSFSFRKNRQGGSLLVVILLIVAVIAGAVAFFASNTSGGGNADKQTNKATASALMSQMVATANVAQLGVADSTFEYGTVTQAALISAGSPKSAPPKSSSAATPGNFTYVTNTTAADGKSHYLTSVDLGLTADVKAKGVCAEINEAAGTKTALTGAATITAALDAGAVQGCVTTATGFTTFQEINRI